MKDQARKVIILTKRGRCRLKRPFQLKGLTTSFSSVVSLVSSYYLIKSENKNTHNQASRNRNTNCSVRYLPSPNTKTQKPTRVSCDQTLTKRPQDALAQGY